MTYLVTGGTGGLGQRLVARLLKGKAKKVIVFSRDEFKQSRMQQQTTDGRLRFLLGDIRDRDRLFRAFHGVDYVIHAAAYKQVPALEYCPMEAVKTNELGTCNVIEASIDAKVKKVVFISSDKAVNPVNLYGSTKQTAEKIMTAANMYSGNKVVFCCVRYGNVIGSRGSVIPVFQNAEKIKITDERMTRFWLTFDEAMDMIFFALKESGGGEIFVPHIPSMKIVDVAKALRPDCEIEFVGKRPGEKLHETLISKDEAGFVRKINDRYFVIMPQFYDTYGLCHQWLNCELMPEDFELRSDTNDRWMSAERLRRIV